MTPFLRRWDARDAAGYGYPEHDDNFAIKQELADAPVSSRRTHLAFTASTRESVIAFYAVAMAQGAVDEGAPELCTDYGDNYFAAFVRDPDGYRLEAVCHK